MNSLSGHRGPAQFSFRSMAWLRSPLVSSFFVAFGSLAVEAGPGGYCGAVIWMPAHLDVGGSCLPPRGIHTDWWMFEILVELYTLNLCVNYAWITREPCAIHTLIHTWFVRQLKYIRYTCVIDKWYIRVSCVFYTRFVRETPVIISGG